MDVYELGDGRQASLVEILGDEKLREVFRYFLSRRWMDEALDVWGKLEQIDHRGNEEEKGRLFLELCKKHFVAGCPNPVNVESDVLQMVLGEFEAVSSSCCSSSSYSFTSPSYSFCSSEETAEDEPLPQEKKGLSKRVMSYLKSEVWLLMASSCLPAFATSEDFTDFLDGKVDSSKGAFSREKAEQFFGCKIEVFFSFLFSFMFSTFFCFCCNCSWLLASWFGLVLFGLFVFDLFLSVTSLTLSPGSLEARRASSSYPPRKICEYSSFSIHHRSCHLPITDNKSRTITPLTTTTTTTTTNNPTNSIIIINNPQLPPSPTTTNSFSAFRGWSSVHISITTPPSPPICFSFILTLFAFCFFLFCL